MKALDLDAVKAFVLTADLKSFTRAAEALDSTQSTISLKLRRLETQLGRRLLERTPRQVRLSAEGAAFLVSARDLVGAHDRAVVSFGVERRRLVIGVSHQIVGSELPSLLRHMNEHDPHLLIELRIAGSREVIQAYDEGKLDAALVLQSGDRHRHGEKLFNESLPGSRPPTGSGVPASHCRCRRRANPAAYARPRCALLIRPASLGQKYSSAGEPPSSARRRRQASPLPCWPGEARLPGLSISARSWHYRHCRPRMSSSIPR